MLLLLLPPRLGVDGVWGAMCSSDFIAFVLALITVIIMNRRIGRHMNQSTHA